MNWLLCVSLALVGPAPTTVAMPGGELLWPQFRGPGGEGHVAQTGLPLEWSDTEGKTKNVVWKTPILGLGWSSAVINGNQVWITTSIEIPPPAGAPPVAGPSSSPFRLVADAKDAAPSTAPSPAATPPAAPPLNLDKLLDGKPAADKKNDTDKKPADDKVKKPAEVAEPPDPKQPPIQLRAICLDRETGKVLHDVLLFNIADPGRIHKKNSHASPTPLLDGDMLYLHFGRHGTACITTAGEIVWKTQELVYKHQHGPGGSPVVFGDLLLLSCDGTDVQYVVGLDKATGKIKWKMPRQGRMAYTTPLLVDVDGQTQLLSSGGDAVIAYDPTTGKELWQCKYDGYSLVPRPVVGHGLAFICTGYNTPSVIAVRLGGTGDVTESHLVWTLKKGAPHNPSPLLVGDELYLIADRGIATCVDAKTGTEIWQDRVGGNFSASPLLADGRIYLLDENGKCTVIAVGKEFKVLAENTVDGRTLASLSVAGKSIFLRTDTHLYRIEQR